MSRPEPIAADLKAFVVTVNLTVHAQTEEQACAYALAAPSKYIARYAPEVVGVRRKEEVGHDNTRRTK